MRLHRRMLAIAVGVAALTLVATACGGGGGGGGAGGGSEKPSEGVRSTSLDYGLIYDQTGPTAATQVPFASGFKTYIKSVNDAGGVAGRKINLIECDEKYQVAPAMACLRQMINQTPVVGLTGLNNSSFQEAGVPVVVQAKVPVIGPESTNKVAANPYPGYVFALLCSYPNQADVAVAYAIKKVGKKEIRAVTLAGNVASAAAYANLIKERVEKAGGTYVKTVQYEYGAPNMDQQAQDIASIKPDVIFTHGGTAQNVIAFKSLEKFGVTSTPLVGIFAQMSRPVVQASQPVGVNYAAVNCYSDPSQTQAAGVAPMVAAAGKAGYGEDIYSTADFTNGYVTGMVAVEGLKRAGANLDRQSLTNAVAGITNFDTQGLSPTISFGPNNSIGVRSARPNTYDYAAKAWVAVGDYSNYAKCDSNEYLTGNIDAWQPDCITG